MRCYTMRCMSETEDFSTNLVTRVAPSMREALEARAKEEDRTVAWLVRKFIAAGLSTEKQEGR